MMIGHKAVSSVLVTVFLIALSAAIVVAAAAVWFSMAQTMSKTYEVSLESSASRTKYFVLAHGEVGNIGTAPFENLTVRFSAETSCYRFNGISSYIRVDNVPVNTASGTYNTVAFLMYWTGTLNQMPFGWNTGYDLYISPQDNFGFNTGGGDVYGISNAKNFLANKWVFVVAVFPNGYPSYEPALYLNGAKQPLQLLQGTRNSGSCTTTLYVSGWGYGGYRFGGYMANLYVYNRMLSDAEAVQLTNAVLYRNSTIPSDGLVLWLDESTVSTTAWKDRTVYGHDGILYDVVVETVSLPLNSLTYGRLSCGESFEYSRTLYNVDWIASGNSLTVEAEAWAEGKMVCHRIQKVIVG